MRTTPTPPSRRDKASGPVLVTGASGMLGWELARAFRASRDDSDVVVCDRAALDIGDEASVQRAFARYRPVLVLNAAAFTAVDAAETQREAAFRANVTGPAHLARFAVETGAKLVHFGTDQVFDGRGETPWKETDTPHPLNYYAETKLLGESEALRAPDALILRVQWLYGETKDRFTSLLGKSVFRPFADLYGAPTWVRPLSQRVVELVERDASGLFHYAHDDYTTWAEVYAFVKEVLGLKVRLDPQPADALGLPARRPRFCALSNRKLVAFLGREGLGGWREPLREFLTRVVPA